MRSLESRDPQWPESLARQQRLLDKPIHQQRQRHEEALKQPLPHVHAAQENKENTHHAEA